MCKRSAEPSYRGHATIPATVNREVACLRAIFSRAVKHGKAERNPAKWVDRLSENNERDRVLSPEEYTRLLAHCDDNLRPIVLIAYHTGMRRGEIFGLTWDMVDLKAGFLHLTPAICKTDEGRNVPLHRELVDMLEAMPRGLPGVRVFTRNGKSIKCVREGFEAACRRAAIEGFTFHDLRHTCITNKDREGHSHIVIMASTGHKTMNVFRRYRAVSREDLRTLVEAGNENGGQYLDSEPKKEAGEV